MHSANSDSVQLAISVALADSFKLASSTQLTSSGLVRATMDMGSYSAKHLAPEPGDKGESATLATIVWPGSELQEASASAPQHPISSPKTASPSSPRSPVARHIHRKSVLSTQALSSRHTSSAVPEIVSDGPIMSFEAPASTVDLYPVAPPTPPNDNPLYVAHPSCTSDRRAQTSPFIRPPAALRSAEHLPRRDSFSRTPLSTMSAHSSSRSPLPRSPSMKSQPPDLSPASARGGWVRRDVRRSRVRLGADRMPSLSASRHTPAAGGPAVRSSGSAALRPSSSAIELGRIATFGSLASSMDGSQMCEPPADNIPPVRTGRSALRRSDVDGSQLSMTPPASVAGSSVAASPRLPWAPRSERRQPVRFGAVSKSPAASARHTPAAHGGSSFLNEYDDVESLVRLRRSSTVGSHVLRPSASAIEMLSGHSMVGSASFMSAAGRTDAPSDGAALSPRSGRRPLLAARLGGTSERARYLQAMQPPSDLDTRRSTAPEDIPLGIHGLNFRTYDFALSRQFTFSDGSRIRMPQDPQRGVPSA